MSDFVLKPATRQGVKPLVGFYGKSGSGKTMSALLFARGLVGPAGRIGLIDSENGRGSIFADLIPGGYFVLDLGEPFSPERYEEAITAVEKQADVAVIDSMSHEWGGEGGVLDMQEEELTRMAGDNWGKREACKMASWIRPKLAHKHFVNRLLRSSIPVICCLRGEEKTRMEKGGDGKTKVITDDFSTPLSDPRFIFEMLLNFETIAKDGSGGYVVARKITHPSVAKLLPGPNEQIGVKHGEALAVWCRGTSEPSKQPASAPKTKPSAANNPVAALKKRLWVITAKVHLEDPKRLEQWLWDEGILSDEEKLADLNAARLETVVNISLKRAVEQKLYEMPLDLMP
jgi:hypothetical protein